MITGYIEEIPTLTGKIETPNVSLSPSADSDHRIVTIGSYNFVAVSVETIETEEE